MAMFPPYKRSRPTQKAIASAPSPVMNHPDTTFMTPMDKPVTASNIIAASMNV